jgi:hypothetical protein
MSLNHLLLCRGLFGRLLLTWFPAVSNQPKLCAPQRPLR